MKIVIAHSRYRSELPSGENVVVDTETAALRGADHQVLVLERRSDEIPSWSRLRKAALPASTIWSRTSQRELTTLVRTEKPDVVHVHNTFPLLTASVLAACYREKVPVVVTLHNYKLMCARGDFFRDGASCHNCTGHFGIPALTHGCYRGSRLATIPVVAAANAHQRLWRAVPSAYIFVSDAQRRALYGSGLPAERSFVKWNLVPALTIPAPTPAAQVVYMGRLDQAKGLPVLERAWECLGAARPGHGLKLVIIGSGPLEDDLRSWAAGRDDVEVRGRIAHDQARAVLSGSLAAIVPSVWQETFGLAAVEAISAGVAVVASQAGALPELIRPGTSGELFPIGNSAALANILADVAARPQHWRSMGIQARRDYERRFDPADNLDLLLRIYRFAVTHPTHARPESRPARHQVAAPSGDT